MHALIWIPPDDVPSIAYDLLPLLALAQTMTEHITVVGHADAVRTLAKHGASRAIVVRGTLTLADVLARLDDVQLVLALDCMGDMPHGWRLLRRVGMVQSADTYSVTATQYIPHAQRTVRVELPAVLTVVPSVLDVDIPPMTASPIVETWDAPPAPIASRSAPLIWNGTPSQAADYLLDWLQERGLYDADYPLPNGATLIRQEAVDDVTAVHQAALVFDVGKGLAYRDGIPAPTPNQFREHVQAAFHQQVIPLAKVFGAGVTASRAIVDAAGIPSAYLIGQSGKRIAPDVLVAWGVSGAAQHLHGVMPSVRVVAINPDPDAPIMARAEVVAPVSAYEVLAALQENVTTIRHS